MKTCPRKSAVTCVGVTNMVCRHFAWTDLEKSLKPPQLYNQIVLVRNYPNTTVVSAAYCGSRSAAVLSGHIRAHGGVWATNAALGHWFDLLGQIPTCFIDSPIH